MKKLIFVFVCLFLVSCSPKRYSTQIYGYFDTVVSVDGYFESQDEFDKTVKIIEDTLSRYHNALDIHSENGEAAILNKEKSLTVSDELRDVISFGIKVAEVTDGRCNIAMGAVLEEWHKARESDTPYLPAPESLKEKSKHTDIKSIEISGNHVTLLDPEMSLDFGAVAKGYVARVLSEKLSGCNMTVNLGGNVLVLGNKDGEGWRVGIQDPQGNGVIEAVSVSDTAVVTSGVYQRYFELDGKKYHHIISPDTLYPTDSYLSVTVIYEDAGWADALSTALFNMSLEEGRALLQGFDDISVSYVMPDGKIEYFEK